MRLKKSTVYSVHNTNTVHNSNPRWLTTMLTHTKLPSSHPKMHNSVAMGARMPTGRYTRSRKDVIAGRVLKWNWNDRTHIAYVRELAMIPLCARAFQTNPPIYVARRYTTKYVTCACVHRRSSAIIAYATRNVHSMFQWVAFGCSGKTLILMHLMQTTPKTL